LRFIASEPTRLTTSGAAVDAAEDDIQRQTRHRSVTVPRGYVCHGSLFRNNVSGAVGVPISVI
jgi:hypothetical protein